MLPPSPPEPSPFVTASMSLERACDLVEQAHRALLWRLHRVGETARLPEGVPLADLLVANEIVEEDNDRQSAQWRAAGGVLALRWTMAPALIVALYEAELLERMNLEIERLRREVLSHA
jgi:hypothetical protein